MIESYKLSYNDNVIENAFAGSALVCSGDYTTGTYTRTLYQNDFSTDAGRFNDCIYNYDLLRITTMPKDPITNKLVAPNPPFYVEPECLREHKIHTQTFGFDNTATINTTGWFIWGDNYFSASPDGWNFVVNRNGEHFRIGGTHWNTTGTPVDGGTASYLNYIKSVYRIDGIVYNGNREILYSGTEGASAVTLNKSITGNDFKQIGVKVSVNPNNNFDGTYINFLTPYRTTATRDSLQVYYGGDANWYNGCAIVNWSNNFKTLTCTAAKGFQKSLTSTAAMTGNASLTNKLIYEVWGIK